MGPLSITLIAALVVLALIAANKAERFEALLKKQQLEINRYKQAESKRQLLSYLHRSEGDA